MSPRHFVLPLVLLVAGLLAVGRADEAADEGLLQKYEIPTDGPGLLEYFRSRSFDDPGLERLGKLVQELGDDSFDKRQAASKRLVAIGPPARAALRAGLTDPDLEIRHRAARCLAEIEKEAGLRLQVSAAAVRILKARRPEGVVKVLFDYLPSAEEESIAEEVRLALAELAVRDGKAHPVLVAGLKDRLRVKRAAAGQALLRAGAKDQLPAVRRLLTDPDPLVRSAVAVGLATLKEKEAVPALISLLDALPPRDLARVEELLCRLAGDKTPAFPADDSEAARRKYRTDWEDWWKVEGPRFDTAVLREAARTLGYTSVLLLDGGTLIDLDASNRPRGEINGLQQPLDVQRLPGDRVLVAEHAGNRVTERNSKGEVIWEWKVDGPLVAQRLANGNTFIANREGLVEIGPTGREVFSYVRPAGEFIMRARKLNNGEIALVTQLGVARYVRLDPLRREIKSFGVEVATSGGRIDVMPNGHVLIPEMNNDRVVERDENGKAVREILFQKPIAASYLPNGHVLLTSMTQNRAVELDRAGREVWEYRRDVRVTRAVRP
jgi:hypothetical protein